MELKINGNAPRQQVKAKETKANTKTSKKVDTPSAKSEEAIANTQGSSVRVYSGRMDIAIVNPDNVTVEGLLGDSSLQVAPAKAIKEITQLQQLEAGIDLALMQQTVIQKGIKLRTAEQKTSELAFGYSAQISRTEDSQNRAEFEHQRTQINRKIRENKITILKGKEAKTGIAAQKAKGFMDAIGTIDVDYEEAIK